jgi:TonB family protein
LMRRGVAIALLFLCPQTVVFAQNQQDDNERTVVERVAPTYPDLARRLNLQGAVKLRVTVAPDGAAKGAEVLGGNPVLAKAAQDAVMRWKWAPTARESKEMVELRFHPK